MAMESIKTFLEVAEQESFTRAAEELNYAQSTITLRIQRLEEELGFPLFERIGRKNHLTSAGQEFLPHAAEILRIMGRVSALGHSDEDLQGTLRVGVSESLLFSSVLPVLPRLHTRFPKVDFQLKIGQTTELIALLKQNHLDLLVVSYTPVTDPALLCRYRRQEAVGFFAGPRHPLAGRKNIPLKQLFAYPFIITEPNGLCPGLLHQLAAHCGQAVNHYISVDNFNAICTLLPQSESISYLPCHAMSTAVKDGAVVQLDVAHQTQFACCQLLCHKNKWLPAFAEAFIAEISGQ